MLSTNRAVTPPQVQTYALARPWAVFPLLMESEESRCFSNVLHSRSKRLFLLQKKFLALYLIAANLSPTPKTPVELLLIFKRFGYVGIA